MSDQTITPSQLKMINLAAEVVRHLAYLERAILSADWGYCMTDIGKIVDTCKEINEVGGFIGVQSLTKSQSWERRVVLDETDRLALMYVLEGARTVLSKRYKVTDEEKGLVMVDAVQKGELDKLATLVQQCSHMSDPTTSAIYLPVADG